MNIALACVTQKANLTLAPSDLAWKRQSAGAEFAILIDSGLPAPFGRLFIKRVAKRRASGHNLLMSTLAQPLRCTPIFFGYVDDGMWHYYAYSLLSGVTGLDRVFASSQYRQDQFITRDFISAILRNASFVFQEVNRRGFYYPDFCYRNLMGNPQKGSVLVIDMDSCYPLSASRLPPGVKIDETWWHLYLRSSARSIAWLNPAMLLGMTVVLCKALASFECVPGVTNLATTILHGRPDDQSQLFDLLDESDPAMFCSTYHTAHQHAPVVPQLLTRWRQLMANLRAGLIPSWEDVQNFTKCMLLVTGRGPDER